MGAKLLTLFTTDQDGGPARYKPGQSFRFTVEARLEGVLVPAPGLTLTIACLEDKSSFAATVVGDEPTGSYHGDGFIPITGTPGVWCRRWAQAGVEPSANAVNELRFIVDPLDF